MMIGVGGNGGSVSPHVHGSSSLDLNKRYSERMSDRIYERPDQLVTNRDEDHPFSMDNEEVEEGSS